MDHTQQARPTTAAVVDAAVAAGRRLGLTVSTPVVLHDIFSVVVHLAPSPVVARIPTVRTPGEQLTSVPRRQQAELDVTHWLHDRGVAVLRPSPLLAPRPVSQDGLSITFWEFTELDPTAEPDYLANAESVAALHVALRDYPGELSFLSAAQPDSLTACLDLLRSRPDLIPSADLARASREWEILEPLVRSRPAFEHEFAGVELRPIHGDSPPANIVDGVDHPYYSDFELVCLGPVEWDLAGLGPEYEAAYDRGAHRLGARPLDGRVMAFVNAVGRLRALSILALEPQMPAVTDYVAPVLDQWRALPELTRL